MMSVLGAPVLAEECKKVGGNILLSPSKKKSNQKADQKLLVATFITCEAAASPIFIGPLVEDAGANAGQPEDRLRIERLDDVHQFNLGVVAEPQKATTMKSTSLP